MSLKLDRRNGATLISVVRSIYQRARLGLAIFGPVRGAYVLIRIGASAALSMLGLRQPWVKQRRNPASPRTLTAFKLFAILGTWMEADVVEATVKNAFTQGCDRVLIVDNDSPDETLAVALEAGAEFAHSFSTTTHLEHLRIRLMNEAVSRISAVDRSEHIWWMWLDADEFPHGPGGLTVQEYLATLDQSFRIVGGRFINHYPAGAPHYASGFHPLDYQPLCEELSARMCWSFHRKHPLQRFDRGGPEIRSDIGFHRAISAERPLLEPTEPIFLHHFPFREKETTLRRLQAIFSKEDGSPARVGPEHAASRHMLVRLRSLEAVYAQDWDAVDMAVAPDCRRPQTKPVTWTKLVAPEHVQVRRWYPTPQAERHEGSHVDVR